MTNERIDYLLNKLVEGTISTDERLEWTRILLNPHQKPDIIQSLQAQMDNNVAGPEWAEERLEEMAKTVLSLDKTATVIPIGPGRFSIFYRRLAIAASVFLIVGAASWFLFTKPAQESTLASVTGDPTPGHNQAFLKLGNGQTIYLDSAQNGSLSRQQGADIIKTDSGQLVYQRIDEKPIGFQLNTLSTPSGGQYKLVLPDGTGVWLNAASSITYPTAFIGKSRNVKITGEAYFEVAHNASQPFLVTIQTIGQRNSTVEVLGTHFNINAYVDEMAEDITLLEGAVKVTDAGNTISLLPGQAASVQPDGQISLEKNADVDVVVAWKNGYFQFEHQDVKSIMRQISRWYDVDVQYEGRVPAVYFSGLIRRSSSIRQVLKIMKDANIRFRIEGKKIIVIS